jgi:hypothetical protein
MPIRNLRLPKHHEDGQMTTFIHPIDCACARRGLLAATSCEAFSPAASADRPRGRAPAFDFPDTPAAGAAEYYLYALSSPVMVRHCKRSYLFGKALADKAGMKPDLEALYVGCLLHDLGLEPIFASAEDFETIGAREAARFLSFRGHDRLARLVAAAIELHTSVETAKDPRPEVAFLSMGAFMDVTGARLDAMEGKLIQEIVEEYPREGTKALIATLLKSEIDAKPQSRLARLAARVDVLGLVANAPFHG